VARANREAERRIRENAKRVGLGRRAFLQSLCGAATTLLTLNEAFAALGNVGGFFRMTRESAFETEAAAEALAGDELMTCKPTWSTQLVLGAGPPANIGSRSSPTSLKPSAAATTRSTAFPPRSLSSTCLWTVIVTTGGHQTKVFNFAASILDAVLRIEVSPLIFDVILSQSFESFQQSGSLPSIQKNGLSSCVLRIRFTISLRSASGTLP
jgi:hypothetical protein